MRKLPGIGLLLTCALVLAGCKTAGAVVKPVVCPRLPEAPANLMQPPTSESKVRAILFESPQSPTR